MALIRKNIGQSLIEIVVAVGIISVVLVGVSDLIIRSLGLSNYQANKNVAEIIAQNQLNYYRQMRDKKPSDFFDQSIGNPTSNYSVCTGSFDLEKYNCSISYEMQTNGVQMNVTVTWKEGENQVKIDLSQALAKPTK